MSTPAQKLSCLVTVLAASLPVAASVAALPASSAWAAEVTVTATTLYSTTNVRTGPSTATAIAARVALGTTFTGISSAGWLHVTAGPYTGKYVALSTVKVTATPANPSSPTTPGSTGTSVSRRTTYASTNVRTSPSTSSSIAARLGAGTTITGTLSNGWVKITTPQNQAGRYVSDSVLAPAPAPSTPTTPTGPTTPTPTPPAPTVYAVKAPFGCTSNPALPSSSNVACAQTVQYVLNSWILRTNAPGTQLMTVSGAYGPVTTSNVSAFQKANGLPATGAVDSATWKALADASQATSAITTDKISGAPGDTHPAFPSAVKLGDGRLMIVFTSARGHGSPGGSTWKTYSSDGGYTWSSPEQIALPNGMANTPAGLGIATSGPLAGHPILTTWSERIEANGSKSTHTMVTIGDVNGNTWGGLVDVKAVQGGNNFSASPIVQVDDTNFQQAVYVYAGQTTPHAMTVGLTYDGSTFVVGTATTIAQATDGSGYSESGMVILPDGRWLSLIRNDRGSSQGYICQSISSDRGATWSTPERKFAGSGAPRMGMTKDGKIVVIYRHTVGAGKDGDKDAVYRVSSDNGATWGDEQVVGAHSAFEMAYGTPVANADGTVTFIYASESTGAVSQIVVTGNVPVK